MLYKAEYDAKCILSCLSSVVAVLNSSLQVKDYKIRNTNTKLENKQKEKRAPYY